MHFLPVPGYEGFYEVSTAGQVRSVDRNILGKDGTVYPRKGRILRPVSHKDTQYLMVSLWKENMGASYYVHRLVSLAHIPNPGNLPEVNHIDGNRFNNLVENLEWCSRLGNVEHAINTESQSTLQGTFSVRQTTQNS